VVATYLDDIVAHHRVRAAADTRGRDAREEAAARAPAARDFAGALVHVGKPEGSVTVIAEVKRRSPSKGDLFPLLDPTELARSYAAGGAACLSVLTDAPHFGGSPEDLRRARGAVELPVLRKDFTVCEGDVLDTRAMGADAVLLIAAVLDDAELESCTQLAAGLGMAALVEVHDEEELQRALGAGASLVGVNQRDLRSFAVDPGRAERVAAAIPDGVVCVAESGVSSAEDVARLAAAGFDAVLVGEALVTAADPAGALRALVGGARCS
jgi:indole-3-glycerol phosphate synthase